MAVSEITNGTNGTVKSKALDFTTFRNVVNGSLVDTKAHRQGINPASEKPHFDVPVATEEDLDRAVAAAREALPIWSQTPLAERKKLLLQYADVLEKEKSGFVSLLTTEQGKPTAAAEVEFGLALHWLKEMANLDLPEEVIEETETRQTIVRYTPIGV